jgi:hypothetical protein
MDGTIRQECLYYIYIYIYIYINNQTGVSILYIYIYIKKMPHLCLKLLGLSLKTYRAALVHIIIELNVN